MKVDDLPSWVYFPDKERAEWVNSILKHVSFSKVETGFVKCRIRIRIRIIRMRVDDLPSLVYFPDKVREEWANSILKQEAFSRVVGSEF